MLLVPVANVSAESRSRSARDGDEPVAERTRRRQTFHFKVGSPRDIRVVRLAGTSCSTSTSRTGSPDCGCSTFHPVPRTVITTIVLIRVDPWLIPKAANMLAGVEGVAEVFSVSGDWDLVAIVRVPQFDEIAHVVTEVFPHRPGDPAYADVDGVSRLLEKGFSAGVGYRRRVSHHCARPVVRDAGVRKIKSDDEIKSDFSFCCPPAYGTLCDQRTTKKAVIRPYPFIRFDLSNPCVPDPRPGAHPSARPDPMNSKQLTPLCRRIALGLPIGTPTLMRAQAIPTPESVSASPSAPTSSSSTTTSRSRYFHQLAASSNRINLMDVGKTSNGHAWTLAVISSPENLAKLDRYRQIAQRIAHPDRAYRPRGARAGQGRQGLRRHQRRTARLGDRRLAAHASSSPTICSRAPNDPKIKAILDNAILFLWPSINPDGQNIVVNWYRENVGTPYEVSPLHELYQKYIGHDNNRDALHAERASSRAWSRAPGASGSRRSSTSSTRSAPFPTRIWLPPFAEPIAPRVPALMSREVNTIGMTIAQALESNGQAGATHMGTGFDAWYPGYIDYMPMFQNIAAFWTETALYRYATPHFYTLTISRRTCATSVRSRSTRALARRLVADQGRDRLHGNGVDRVARLRGQVSRRAPLQCYQAGRNAIASFTQQIRRMPT